ncbi:DUF6090 family protein [Saccharicrinis sp. FJH54]|uniref:DUF6090 family protein n=1 Tax=Saccharicrinis sp. FJH54 TaxID=3344665 RepID=UPI0035D4EE61
MFRFFKNIRRNLAAENKAGSYIRYAIGEILLVVIGILIALQVNNRNEQRKHKHEEIQFLKGFKRTLNEDLENSNWMQKQYELSGESINILLSGFERDLPYNDSLSLHFGRITQTWRLATNNEVFETLKSYNLNLISNEKLRYEIVGYYAYSDNYLKTDVSRYFSIIEDASKTIFNTRFNALWNGDQQKFEQTGNVIDLNPRMIPNDYDGLKHDKVFLYFLRSLKNQYYWMIERNLKKVDKDANALIKDIDKELKKLE